METISLNEINLSAAIAKAVAVLQVGDIVIGPTDTVYGIFGNAANEEAIKKIFALKQRSQEKALPIFIKDIMMARQYAYISDAKVKFLEKIWPGAVTVIFHHKGKLPKILTPEKNTIGLRIPDHSLLIELLARLDFPLIQTSANISGKPPAKNLKEIEEYFYLQELKPDLVIDAGEIFSASSAVIDFTRNEPIIVRSGVITKKDLA